MTFDHNNHQQQQLDRELIDSISICVDPTSEKNAPYDIAFSLYSVEEVGEEVWEMMKEGGEVFTAIGKRYGFVKFDFI